MREIKFRAWDTKTQVFTNYALLDGTLRFMDKNTGIWLTEPKENRFMLMQYTGLKDTNGAEIYEGDILHLISKYRDNKCDWKAVVVFGNFDESYSLGYQLKPIDGSYVINDILLWVDSEDENIICEVIGNIYENPELLEVKA